MEEGESMTPLAEEATDGVLRWWRAQRPYVETHMSDVDFRIQKVCHERKNNQDRGEVAPENEGFTQHF